MKSHTEKHKVKLNPCKYCGNSGAYHLLVAGYNCGCDQIGGCNERIYNIHNAGFVF